MPAALPGSATLLLQAPFKRAGREAAIPASEFITPDLDPARLAHYNALFGFGADALPVTYYYLLAQRAQLATMLAPAFPFRLLGMIHAENALREERRPDLRASLVIATGVDIETPTAQGAHYCTLHSRATQDGTVVFSCTSRYLAVRGKSVRDGVRHSDEESLPLLANWDLAQDAGRRYASVSGDWNPIHLWPWSARLFGLPSPIIHGMHTMAAACARLEQASGQRVRALSARFKAHVPLGSQLAMHADIDANVYRVRCSGKLAVEGEFEPESAQL